MNVCVFFLSEPDSDPNATANDIMVTKSVTIDNPALSSSLRGDNPDYKAAGEYHRSYSLFS